MYNKQTFTLAVSLFYKMFLLLNALMSILFQIKIPQLEEETSWLESVINIGVEILITFGMPIFFSGDLHFKQLVLQTQKNSILYHSVETTGYCPIIVL